MESKTITRRELIAGLGGAALAKTLVAAPPASPVAISRCRSYDQQFASTLKRMFDQVGGIRQLIRGKTIALKLNLTGNPERFPERPDMPYRNHPATVLATAQLFSDEGARRIRIIESFFPAKQDLELWARYGLDVKAIGNVGCKVEWENAQNLGLEKAYKRVKVPWGGYMYPAYDLNHSYVDCDTYVSLSKLKNHWHAGITMTMKNNFGITPCSLYGGDCGQSGNENPQQERGQVCHNGNRTPPQGVPQELDMRSPRDPGFRIPRIVVDLVGARPIDLSIVDGIESIRGGEGVWNEGVQVIKPGLVLVGRNPVCTDTVCTAVMGADPLADRGHNPFIRGDNMLKLAEEAGIGTTDLKRIEVRGLSIKEALCDYGPGPVGKPV